MSLTIEAGTLPRGVDVDHGAAVKVGPAGGDTLSAETSGRTYAQKPSSAVQSPSVARPALITLAVVLLAGLLELTVVGRFTHESTQTRLYDRLRNELALGTAPVSEVDDHNRAIADGTPLAIIDIPSIGVHEVVAEGTRSEVLVGGPGHLRDTPLPGEAGTSQIFGRAAAFGGPFGSLHRLHRGDVIRFTTGAGVAKYRVIDVRRPGELMPPALETGAGRVTLLTADGLPFVPSRVLRVDADLVGKSSAPTVASVALSSSERAMGIDTGSLFALVLWLEALLVVVGLGALSWRRWGRVETWIVFIPVALLVGYALTDEVARLLPNLT